jgi:peptide/nickel transport system permease protein
MTRYIARRLVYLLVQVFLVATIVFLLLRLVPGDPARAVLGETASEEQVATMRQRLGIDRPFVEQYAIWLGGVVRGDLGRSIINSDPVGAQIASRIGNTLELAWTAIGLALLVGIPLGIVAAVRANRGADFLVSSVAILGLSMPSFVVGTVLLLVFGLLLRWLPQQQFVPLAANPSQHLQLLALPVVTLATSSSAVMMRMTRASMMDVVRQDYLRTARAKGLTERLVLLRHALKNALIPTVTVVGLQVGYLLGGTVLTETVFARPGLGRLLVDSIARRDIAVVQTTIMLLSATFVLVNLVVDLLYVKLDPRIRYD